MPFPKYVRVKRRKAYSVSALAVKLCRLVKKPWQTMAQLGSTVRSWFS